MPKRVQASVELNNINMELKDKRYNDIRPVSYTHLDVYKRQLINTIIYFCYIFSITISSNISNEYKQYFESNYVSMFKNKIRPGTNLSLIHISSRNWALGKPFSAPFRKHSTALESSRATPMPWA